MGTRSYIRENGTIQIKKATDMKRAWVDVDGESVLGVEVKEDYDLSTYMWQPPLNAPLGAHRISEYISDGVKEYRFNVWVCDEPAYYKWQTKLTCEYKRQYGDDKKKWSWVFIDTDQKEPMDVVKKGPIPPF